LIQLPGIHLLPSIMMLTKFLSLILLAATQVASHGLITRIIGANGIEMPGLTGKRLSRES
jgi:hypothetical protein